MTLTPVLLYDVTNDTNPLSTNTPRYPRSSTPFSYATVTLSVPRAGAPAVKWTKTNNCSLNFSTALKYLLMPASFHGMAVLLSSSLAGDTSAVRTNCLINLSSSITRSNNQFLPSTLHLLMAYSKKLNLSDHVSLGLSLMSSMFNSGNVVMFWLPDPGRGRPWSSMSTIITFCNNWILVLLYNPCTVDLKSANRNDAWPMVISFPCHSTVPGALVVYLMRMPNVLMCNIQSIGVGLWSLSANIMNLLLISCTRSKMLGATCLALASLINSALINRFTVAFLLSYAL